MEIRKLESDEAITEVFPLMHVLRERLARETLVREVRRQQEQGYQLLAGYRDGVPVVLAGIRHTHTLSRGDRLV